MKRFLVLLLLLDPSNGRSFVSSATKNANREPRALQPSTWVEITFDTFEDDEGDKNWGSYVDGGGQAKLEDKSYFDDYFSSSFSAVVRDDKAPPDSSFFHQGLHNVTQFDDLKIHFWYYSKNMKDNEHEFLIEYATAPEGPWNIVQTINVFSNKVPLEKTITFAPSIDVPSMSSIMLRFRCNGKDKKTKVYVDQILFQGHVANISSEPSSTPSAVTTSDPSTPPSWKPSQQPSEGPSSMPTPSPEPSSTPSARPTAFPSTSPSWKPSTQPSKGPSPMPSLTPSSAPSHFPSSSPSWKPSQQPSEGPSPMPTPIPEPSRTPSAAPSRSPTRSPSSKPSQQPTADPTPSPTAEEILISSLPPTEPPTTLPTTFPTPAPSNQPTSVPSIWPSSMPTPIPEPSATPSAVPSHSPSTSPSLKPSQQPTEVPSSLPSLAEQTESPTDTLTRDEICPVDRLYPPSKYEIMPYTPAVSTSGVEDDLAEISSLAITDQTDPEGNLYAYAASDKNQFSIKVLRFRRHAETGQVIMGTATTVATYALDVHYSNSDWEDISLGPCSSASQETCLYIGNFGNNDRGGGYVQRSILKIFKFPEPVWNLEPSNLVNVPVTTILYQYAAPGFEETRKYDAEAMFVDWVGSSTGSKADIYIITKGKCGTGRVGVIHASHHENMIVGNVQSNVDVPDGADVYSMEALMLEPPKQGVDITCDQGPFRLWQGADMTRDGRLIALITGQSPPRVYFYPRLADQTVLEALTSDTSSEAASCPYIASTSYGLEDERKHEAVAFLPDGKGFADTSECDGGSACDVPIYFWDLLFPDSPDATFSHGLVPASDDGGWDIITDDDFEVGDHLGSFVNGTRAYPSQAYTCPSDTSNWSIHINEHKGPESAITHRDNQNASTYAWLKVEFDFLLDGFDHMDTLFLELSLDGGTSYFIVADWAKDTQGIFDLKSCYMKNTVAVNAAAFDRSTFGPQVRLRFRTSANAKNDRVYIDNVLFQGHA